MVIKIYPTKKEFDDTILKCVSYLKNDIKIDSVILFGSVARDDYSLRHSDIDLYLLINDVKNKDFERKLWRYVNDISSKIQVHLSFEYSDLLKEGSLLRYNILKEGKILFERSKGKSIFLKKDFDLEEVYYIKLDLKKLQPYEKSNFKRSMTSRYKKFVLDYSGNIILVKKCFYEKFNELAFKKNIGFKILYEFMYREGQEFDE